MYSFSYLEPVCCVSSLLSGQVSTPTWSSLIDFTTVDPFPGFSLAIHFYCLYSDDHNAYIVVCYLVNYLLPVFPTGM